MAKQFVNPIDPVTGKRQRGRPRRNLPVDTIRGPQPVEKAAGQNGGRAPAEVAAVDDRKDIEQSTETARFWRDRMRGTSLLTIPLEVRKQYPHIPEDCFCWAPNTADGMSLYTEQFNYEPVQLAKPMRGQLDNGVKFRELVLMVRTPEMKQIHDEVRREAVLAQRGDAEGYTQAAEREAEAEIRAEGGRPGDIAYFDEEETRKTVGKFTPEVQARLSTEEVKDRIAADQRRARVKGAAGRGSKYVQGGIPQ